MPEQLVFDLKHIYPDDPDGITLEVILRHGDQLVRMPASVDYDNTIYLAQYDN